MPRTRSILLVALALAAVLVAPWSAGAAAGATISGTVRTFAGGAPVPGTGVALLGWTSNGGVRGVGTLDYTTTAADGGYRFTGVAPGGPYYVCFDAPAGYVSQCFENAPGFADFPDPYGFVSPAPGSKPIYLLVGNRTGVDAALRTPDEVPTGGISGAVRQGHLLPLKDVQVEFFSMYGTPAGGSVTTNGAGAYQALGLAPGAYFVCFDLGSARGGIAPHGFADACYSNAPWTPGGEVGEGAQPVIVRSGATTGGIGLTPQVRR